MVQTLSHGRCPTTGAWICPADALELCQLSAFPSSAACQLCRAWSSRGNLVWVQGLMLVGRRPHFSLACAGQEAGRKLCPSAAEQIWPGSILAMMGKNQCFE